jgi:hypothetical protein
LKTLRTGEFGLNFRHIFGPIYPQMRLGRPQHADRDSVLQGAQLLERLGLLERGGREGGMGGMM